MTTIFHVKRKIGLNDGSYTCIISDGKIENIFKNSKAMKKILNFLADGGAKIKKTSENSFVQYMEGQSEEEIANLIRKSLEESVKYSTWFAKMSFEEEKK